MNRLKLEEYNRLSKSQQIELIKRCYNFPKLKVMRERTDEELAEGCIFFINMFCEIYDKEKGRYTPFTLFPIQEDYIRECFKYNKLNIVNFF